MVAVRTMLLNADGKFQHMHNRFRAVALANTDRVSVLYWWDDQHSIRSQNEVYAVPALMIYHHYINMHKRLTHVALTRENVFHRDSYTCQYCGKGFQERLLTFDHIVPQDRGGPTTWLNITTACKKCNNRKDNRTPEEARMPLLSQPYAPKFGTFKGLTSRKIGGKIHESWIPYIDDS